MFFHLAGHLLVKFSVDRNGRLTELLDFHLTNLSKKECLSDVVALKKAYVPGPFRTPLTTPLCCLNLGTPKGIFSLDICESMEMSIKSTHNSSNKGVLSVMV